MSAIGTTESRIIEAVIELVGELGYKGTTTRLIAERAGVNEVTLFRRFGSKEALVQMAIPFAQNELRAAFVDVRREKSGALGVDLTNIALSVMEILGKKRETVLATMSEARREPSAMEATKAMVKFTTVFIREFLEGYDLKNPISGREREIISLGLASFIFYRVVVRERLLPDEFTSKNRREEVGDYVGLLLREGRR